MMKDNMVCALNACVLFMKGTTENTGLSSHKLASA